MKSFSIQGNDFHNPVFIPFLSQTCKNIRLPYLYFDKTATRPLLQTISFSHTGNTDLLRYLSTNVYSFTVDVSTNRSLHIFFYI